MFRHWVKVWVILIVLQRIVTLNVMHMGSGRYYGLLDIIGMPYLETTYVVVSCMSLVVTYSFVVRLNSISPFSIPI